MKCNPFKLTAIALLFSSMLLAQKVEKKYNEKFYTNKDVEININASNADIEVTTWNKNEVEVNAYIEVEGLEKEDAEKYLKNWNFEALGNKKTVKINASSNQFHAFGKDNFVFFNNFNDSQNLPKVYHFNHEGNDDEVIVIPDVDDFDFPIIELNEFVMPDLEDFDFDFDKYDEDGGNYFIQWKDGVNDVTIKSKEEWEKFKKTKEYKKLKKELEKKKKNLKKRAERRKVLEEKKELLKKRKEERKEALEKQRELKIQALKARSEALKKAKKALKNTRFNYYFSNDNDFIVNDKKVKVTKKIIIKVPKNATFNLNTRHCKVKLPKTKAVGKVSYGSFNADELNGGNLKIIGSPVTIQTLNACTLFLNNVQDANVNYITNAELNSNSTDIKIEEIQKDVTLSNTFGKLFVNKIQPNFNNVYIELSQSDAILNLNSLKETLEFETKNTFPTRWNNTTLKHQKNNTVLNGNFTAKAVSNKNTLKVKGKFSKLEIQ